MIILAALAFAFTQTATKEPLPVDVAAAAVDSLVRQSREPDRAIICLVVDDNDPSKELMATFQLTAPRIVPGSACHYEELPNRREVARTNAGAPAEFLKLSGFNRRGRQEVAVDYEFRSGSWTGRGSTIVFELRDGQWQAQSGPRYEWVE